MASSVGEPVQAGNLLLAYTSDAARMFQVMSAPGNTNADPAASSISVTKVNWHITEEKGFWTLDGPSVHYCDDPDDDSGHGGCCCPEGDEASHSKNCPEKMLDVALDSLGGGDSQVPSVIVNPGGKDVLQHFFKGSCPYCSGSTWFCPGCGGVSEVFPDHFASCGFDMSCPVCMGYEFALDDKSRLQELDRIETRLFFYKDGNKSSMSKADWEALRNEGLQLVRERREWIQARQEEMGYNPEDVDKLVREWKEAYFDESKEAGEQE